MNNTNKTNKNMTSSEFKSVAEIHNALNQRNHALADLLPSLNPAEREKAAGLLESTQQQVGFVRKLLYSGYSPALQNGLTASFSGKSEDSAFLFVLQNVLQRLRS